MTPALWTIVWRNCQTMFSVSRRQPSPGTWASVGRKKNFFFESLLKGIGEDPPEPLVDRRATEPRVGLAEGLAEATLGEMRGEVVGVQPEDVPPVVEHERAEVIDANGGGLLDEALEGFDHRNERHAAQPVEVSVVGPLVDGCALQVSLDVDEEVPRVARGALVVRQGRRCLLRHGARMADDGFDVGDGDVELGRRRHLRSHCVRDPGGGPVLDEQPLGPRRAMLPAEREDAVSRLLHLGEPVENPPRR